MKKTLMLMAVALVALVVYGCGKQGATEEATTATKNFINEGVDGAATGLKDAEKAVGNAVRDADAATFGDAEKKKAEAKKAADKAKVDAKKSADKTTK